MVTTAGGPSDVFVLDLDGVIVDSEPEVSMCSELDCMRFALGPTCTCVTLRDFYSSSSMLSPQFAAPLWQCKPGPRALFMHSLLVRVRRLLQLSGTGYAAAAELWPDVFADVGGDRRAALMAGMRVARTRLVSGFEAMVMVRGP